MKLKNNKTKPITILYQGKKIIVNPSQVIDGPIQLSIYGLTPETSTQITAITNPVHKAVEIKYEGKKKNDKEVDDALNFVNSYDKNNLPSVAICILSKDSFNLISDCINSINKHVNYKNLSIFIFDTGTTEQQTLNFYENIVKTSRFPLQIISVGEYHFSKNYNLGLKLVNADYFLIQNNDTVAINDYVTKLVRVACNKKIGACGPRMLYKDGLIQHDGQLLYDHQVKKFGSPTHVNLKKNVANVSTGVHLVDGITCAGMMIKSNVYWEAEGLNEDYHDIFQDVELNIKIRMNGHLTVCDRDALINHYDNTSRNVFWANNVKKLKLKHLDYSLLFGKFGNELKYIDREKKKFSIVTLVNNVEIYTNFLNDIKEQDCSFEFEIIPIPNFNNEFDSCSNALNIGISLSESEYIIMCHQDIRVPKNWLSNIYEKIRNFIINDVKFGVLGMAGSWAVSSGSDGVMFLGDTKRSEEYIEVQCLDELCLIIKNGNDIRFDEQKFPHYHCYGSDLCLTYISKGYRNFALNCPCTHLSDGFSNLVKPEHLEMYIKNTITLFKKWRTLFSEFRNTTARFNRRENSILFYVADELKKQGVNINRSAVLPD